MEREYDVAPEWVPYELHPEIPPGGRPRDQVLPAAYRTRVEAGLRALAANAGLKLTSHDRLINSRPALQAAEHARQQGRFKEAHAELFRMYWIDGLDISKPEVLGNLADRIGLDQSALLQSVESDAYGDYLDARRQEALDLMIDGIPAHVIADRYLVMGAQPYEHFERVMQRLGIPRRSSDYLAKHMVEE